jgi:predicted permease
MAQAVERRPELAARAALGASRGGLVRQLVLEALALALIGGALGTALAWLGLRALAPLLPDMTLPDEMRIGLNLPMLGASIIVAIAAGVLASLLPALRMTQGDLALDLRTGARAVGRGGHQRIRALFVLTQVVLSLVLLVGAGLLARSFAIETGTPLGYSADRMLFAWLVVPPEPFSTGPARAQVLDRIVERARRLPGVTGIGAGQFFPPMGGVPTELEAEGSAAGRKMGDLAITSRTFFDVLAIEPTAGRLLTDDDAAQQRKVAVINQRLAAEMFGTENPLGRRVKIAQLERASTPLADPWFEIVGIVPDLKNAGVRDAVVPGIYISHSFASIGGFGIVLRTEGDPQRLATPLARAVQEVQPTVVPQYTKVLSTWIEAFYFARPRFSLTLVTAFTAVGLLLTCVGVYSVVSFAVAQRHRELGIRMSLGATPRAVVRTVIGGTLLVVAVGLLIGHAIAAYVARLMATHLWGIAPGDPMTLALSTGLILLVAALACLLPALRAARLNPAEVLRSER